jgi:hypothetical protein
VNGNDQFPPITPCFFIHPGNDTVKKRGLTLCIRTGNRKHFPIPDPKAGDRTVAGRKFQFDWFKRFRAGKRYIDTLFWPGCAKEATVACAMTCQPCPVADK